MVIENISLNRRQFLGGVLSTGAFVVASRLVPEELFAQAPAGAAIFNTKADTAALHPSVYLGIEPDGTVFIVTHRSEMGTGIRTSLPLVAADELDADWSRVPHRAGRRRHALRRSEHRRIAIDSRLLRRVPRRGRVGAVDARERRGGADGTCPPRSDDGESRSRAREERQEARLRRARRRGGEAARAEGRRSEVQAEDRVEVRRQGAADLRLERHRHRQGASSASTSIATAWCSRRSSIRPCSAAR